MAVMIQKEKVVGHKIVSVLRTAYSGPPLGSDIPFDPAYCTFVIVLDNAIHLRLSAFDLKPYSGSEDLVAVDSQDTLDSVPVAEVLDVISNVLLDQEDRVYIALANGKYIVFDFDVGSNLGIGNIADVNIAKEAEWRAVPAQVRHERSADPARASPTSPQPPEPKP